MSDLSTVFQRVAAKWPEIGDLGVICPPGHFTVWHEDDQWSMGDSYDTEGIPERVAEVLIIGRCVQLMPLAIAYRNDRDEWCVSQLVSTLASGAPSHVIARLLAFEAMKEAQARKDTQ